MSKQIQSQDIDELQNWVRKYYQEIQNLPAQDTKDFKDFLDDENSLHQGEFNTMAAVEQLWSYVKQVRSSAHACPSVRLQKPFLV